MKKIIVIGAGPAGITAGCELLRQDKEMDVTILEKANAPGGLCRTLEFDGNRMDCGGHKFVSDNENVINWWKEILPVNGMGAYDDRKLKREYDCEVNGPDPEFENDVLLSRKRYSKVYFEGKYYNYPVKINGATLKNLGMGKAAKAGLSYFTGNIFKKKECTLEDLYINCFGKQLYTMFFEGYTEKAWGRRPSQILLKNADATVKGEPLCEILKTMAQDSIHNEAGLGESGEKDKFFYPKYGAGQLWCKAALEFQKLGGQIHYNCEVIGVETVDNRVKGIRCMIDGEELFEEADVIISSMAVKDLIASMKDVPDDIRNISKNLSYRDFINIGVIVPKLYLTNNRKVSGLADNVPDTWIYIQDTKVKLAKIQIYNNWSPYLVKYPEHSVLLGLEYYCNEGDFYWNLSDAKWKEYVRDELVRLGVIARDTEIMGFVKELVPKAFPTYFDSFEEFDKIVEFLDSFTNLYCIGRNGQHRASNMEDVMGTAFEAVYNIINKIPDRSNIWRITSDIGVELPEDEEEIIEEEPKDEVHAAINPALLESAKEEIDKEKETNEELDRVEKIERKTYRKTMLERSYRSFRNIPKELLKYIKPSSADSSVKENSEENTDGKESGEEKNNENVVAVNKEELKNTIREIEAFDSSTETVVPEVEESVKLPQEKAIVVKAVDKPPMGIRIPIDLGEPEAENEENYEAVESVEEKASSFEPVPVTPTYFKPDVASEPAKSYHISKSYEVVNPSIGTSLFGTTAATKPEPVIEPAPVIEPEPVIEPAPVIVPEPVTETEAIAVEPVAEEQEPVKKVVHTFSGIWDEVAKSERDSRSEEAKILAEKKNEENHERIQKNTIVEQKVNTVATKEYDKIVVPKDIFANAKVIKSTVRIKNQEPEAAPKPVKSKPKDENVIAIVKDGVVIPVDKNKNPVKGRKTRSKNVDVSENENGK